MKRLAKRDCPLKKRTSDHRKETSLSLDMNHGTVKEVASTPKIIEWIIDDYFELPKHGGYSLYSPEFKFLQFTCKLSALPNGTVSLPELAVFVLHGIGKHGMIRWEIQARRTNGSLLKRCRGVKEDGDEMAMNMYLPLIEIQKGCAEEGFFKVRCMLWCDDGIHEELQDENHKISQTDELTGYDKLSCDLEEMMIREDYYDVIIKIQGKDFKAHKSVIGVRAAVFTDMHKKEMKENPVSIVELDDCDAVAFGEFLRYLYSGKIANFSPNVLFKLHKISEKYKINELKAFCLGYIMHSLTVATFCDAIVLAVQSKREDLVDMGMKFLSENLTEISYSKKWQEFEARNLDAAKKMIQRALELQEQKSATRKESFFQKLFRKNKI